MNFIYKQYNKKSYVLYYYNIALFAFRSLCRTQKITSNRLHASDVAAVLLVMHPKYCLGSYIFIYMGKV